MTKGLTATADLWPDVQTGYAWVHRAAHILTNADQHTAKARATAISILVG
jgi:hypothetical protein